MSQDLKTLIVGTAATDLDIYITAGQNGSPLDPTDIRFRIFDPTGVEAVTETLGTKVNVGVYTASGAIIPADRHGIVGPVFKGITISCTPGLEKMSCFLHRNVIATN